MVDLHCILYWRARANSSVEQDIILKLCIRKASEWKELPSPVQYLQEGGLEMVKSEMLPFLRRLVGKVVFFNQWCKEKKYGKNMIDLAVKEIDNDLELFGAFKECLSEVLDFTNYEENDIASVYLAFTKKIVRARINEYMTAADEIDLQEAGKIVKA